MSLELDALLTATQAAAQCHVSPARIRRWAKSYPHLMPATKGKDGRPRYRLGDVLEVERATRQGARLRPS